MSSQPRQSHGSLLTLRTPLPVPAASPPTGAGRLGLLENRLYLGTPPCRGERVELDLDIPEQKQNGIWMKNWCWAAVALGIWRYFNKGAGVFPMCRIANLVLGSQNCCSETGGAACDVPAALDDALKTVKRNPGFEPRALTESELREHLEKLQLPVAVRLEWKGGGGHFVVIYGYRIDDEMYLLFDDSIYGRSVPIAYSEITKSQASYMGRIATWDESYRVS